MTRAKCAAANVVGDVGPHARMTKDTSVAKFFKSRTVVF